LLNCGLPEPLKGQRHIVLFALPAQGCLSARVTTQPAAHQLAQTVLEASPSLLIALHDRTIQQLEAICIIGGLSTMIRLEFPSALLSEGGDTQYTGSGV
jgi:hypothetical protein